jgi:hypothetical protein
MSMFLLKFKVEKENKEMLLHDGEVFVGGNTHEQAEYASLNNSAKAVSVGGFDIVEVTIEKLAEMIGTTVENPQYKILAVHGGLIPFNGVEIVKE